MNSQKKNRKNKQKKYYSGKKKRHTLKSQVFADKKSGQIICTNFANGKKHDFRLFKESKLGINKKVKVLVDTGFQGIHKFYKNLEIPKKKTKKRPSRKRKNQKIMKFLGIKLKLKMLLVLLNVSKFWLIGTEIAENVFGCALIWSLVFVILIWLLSLERSLLKFSKSWNISTEINIKNTLFEFLLFLEFIILNLGFRIVLLSAPTSITPSKLVQYLKGRSSKLLQDEFSELKKRYWGQHLWARGYFCVTVGSVTKEMIQEYIEKQFEHGDKKSFKIEQ